MNNSEILVSLFFKTVRIVVPFYGALFFIVLLTALFGGGEGSLLVPSLGFVLALVFTGLMFINGRTKVIVGIVSGLTLSGLTVTTYIIDGVSEPLVFQLFLLFVGLVIATFFIIRQWRVEARLRANENRQPHGVMPSRFRGMEEPILQVAPVVGIVGTLIGYFILPNVDVALVFLIPGVLMIANSTVVGFSTNWLRNIERASPPIRKLAGASFVINSVGVTATTLIIILLLLIVIWPFVVGGTILITVLTVFAKMKGFFDGVPLKRPKPLPLHPHSNHGHM